MMREFHMTKEQAMDELPLAEGFALLSWNMESNPWIQMERVSDGYIAQEAYKRSRLNR